MVIVAAIGITLLFRASSAWRRLDPAWSAAT